MTVIYIARNELQRLFFSPLAWIILAIIQFILTVSFLRSLDQFMTSPGAAATLGVSKFIIPGTLQSAGLLLLFISPLITMRLISDERKSGTLTLLLSSPVTVTGIILGKYLGIMFFYLILLIMISLLPLSLAFGTSLDFGLLVSGLTGLFLLCSSFAAIGMFASTLARQPAVAAIITFGLLFLLWIMHVLATTDYEALGGIINYLAIQHHLSNLLVGVFSSVDIIYYLLLNFVFILLSIIRLDSIRYLD